MTATNHALTGTLIGLSIGQPLIALPLAFLSHFILDALPHYKTDMPDDEIIRSNWFKWYLVAEALICLLIVIALAIFQPVHWQLAAVCAFLAASPDLFSINKYLKTRSGKPWKASLYIKFANGIQWFSRPIGAIVEVVWFISTLILIAPYLSPRL